MENLTAAATVHPQLTGYFLTPESVEPLQDLLDQTAGTKRCVLPILDWGCWTTRTRDEAQLRMVQLLKHMDSVLNPHRLLSAAPTAPAVKVLDPRIRNIVQRFLPQLSTNEQYSFSEIEDAATRFAKVVEESGLALFAMTSPCHTDDPQALTCSWSNFPGQVNFAAWLKAGKDIHPRLAGTYFTQRAAAGLGALLQRGETPAAQELLAELVLKIDKTFSPYFISGHSVTIDGSVAALEYMISQNPPPNPNRISADYAKYMTDIVKLKWAPYFQSAYQMICHAVPQADHPFIGTTSRITCGYVTTAPDVL